MTPETLAEIHAACFDGAPRAWSADEFRDMLALPGALLLERPGAFALARRAGPEMEVLTLAVHPDARRRGIALALLRDLDTAARDLGVEELILEVAETNAAARQLYLRAGYAPAAVRKDYYAGPGGQRITALVLRKVPG